MNSSLDYILEQLDKYLEAEMTKPERLITSGHHFRGWLNDRTTYNKQVLINAIQYSIPKFGPPPYESILQDIQKEFSSVAEIKSIPFPYDDLDAMKNVIDGLLEHFKPSFSAADVIVDIGERPSKGYLVLTIIKPPVIV